MRTANDAPPASLILQVFLTSLSLAGPFASARPEGIVENGGEEALWALWAMRGVDRGL